MSIEPFPVLSSIKVFARATEEIVTAPLVSNLSKKGRGQVVFQNKKFHRFPVRKV
jgi:flagellar assembly factor FliW